MIHFLPFDFVDFERLKSWVVSEKELIQFAGPIFTFPLTDAQLEKYSSSTKRKVYTINLDETKEVIGHCEFNFENEIPRISRVLIGDEKMRNRGIGTEIIQKMSEAFFTDSAVSKIDLNVFAWNDRAIACYKKVGFKVNNKKNSTYQFKNEEWDCFNMEINLH